MCRIKRVFISQPMSGLSDQQIHDERLAIMCAAKSYFWDEPIEFADSMIQEVPPEESVVGLWYLAKSLEVLSTCDVLVYTDAAEKYRGCSEELDVAIQYGIEIINLSKETALRSSWIYVEEFLPSDVGEDWVLVQLEDVTGFTGVPNIAEYRESTGKWYMIDRCGDLDEVDEIFKVKAWMPLPTFGYEISDKNL